MESFDVIVVGGRCAGAALAVHLARADLRVCLVDKSTFPSETPSTHVIQPRGVEILAELGALTTVLSHGAAQLNCVTLEVEDVRLDCALDDSAAYPGLNVRRTILDHALQQAAVSAGVDVRPGCRVTGVRMSDGRAVGIDTVDGPVSGALVVGADGRGSVVAESVGARQYLMKPAGRIPIWGYFRAGPQEPRLHIGHKGNLAFLASPTDSGLYMATVGVDHRQAHAFSRDRETNYYNALREWPEIHNIVSGAQREGSLRVMMHWHSYFRESAGPGWVLLGDAGHFKDFTAGQGISDALCQARSLSASISTANESAAQQDSAMTHWWHNRDRDSYDMYWFSAQMAPPGAPSPLSVEVLRRIARDPRGPATLLKVINRDLPSSKLLTTGRLLAATYTTLRDHPHHRRSTFTEIGEQLAAEMTKLRARLRPAVP